MGLWRRIQLRKPVGPVLLVAVALTLCAQESPAKPAGTPASQVGQTGVPAASTPASAKPAEDDALDNPLLEAAGVEEVVTYLDTHIDFEYRHDQLEGGANSNEYDLTLQKTLGPKQRFAVAIELPFVNLNGDELEETSTTGFGDMKLRLRGMIWKGEKFEHAAEIEVTLPSASSDLIGEGETVLRMVWGFTAQVAKHTLLSGEVGYNKALVNHRSGPGTNSIEPELILSQQLAKRVAGYLDWDNYYDFTGDEYIQTMKPGLVFGLDKNDKWTFSPFAVFPLNHATRLAETNFAAGCNLTYTF